MSRDDWNFGDFFAAGFGPRFWAFCGPEGRRPGRGRRRQQMFESGEVKYVILRLLKEKPRHGYEVIKALEEKMGGWYTPSAGTVYPTLQLLEDQGLVRAVETEGKKVYHITPEGESFLEEHRDVIDEILDRVRDAVRGFTGGSMGELNQAFARLAGLAYRHAWRAGPGDERTGKIVEILRRAGEEIEGLRKGDAVA
ncbi:MAG: PadR family transcriptional regulator [Gemmatimonadetes bacterium]|nr:PadR family transcriptional regulator [Gemmatimonadota bacterium]